MDKFIYKITHQDFNSNLTEAGIYIYPVTTIIKLEPKKYGVFYQDPSFYGSENEFLKILKRDLSIKLAEDYLSSLKLDKYIDERTNVITYSMKARIISKDDKIEMDAKIKTYKEHFKFLYEQYKIEEEKLNFKLSQVQSKLNEIENKLKFGSLWTKIKLVFKGK